MKRTRYSLRNGAPLPGTGGRGSRERQSLWCCGVNYARWRFVTGEFPGTHHETCFMCGKKLPWPPSSLDRGRTPKEKRTRDREVWLASYHRRSEKFQKQGLTSHGKKRERRPSISDYERAWREEREAMGNTNLPEVIFGLERHA